jgi:hypothetical protein
MDKCIKCGERIVFNVRRETTRWNVDKNLKKARTVTIRCPRCGTYNSKEVEE